MGIPLRSERICPRPRVVRLEVRRIWSLYSAAVREGVATRIKGSRIDRIFIEVFL
jgi:hypothetical protein